MLPQSRTGLKNKVYFVVFIYSYYGHLGTAVAAFQDTKKWPGILKFSRPIKDRIKEHDRRPYPDLRRFRARPQHVNTGHYPLWDEVKFIILMIF